MDQCNLNCRSCSHFSPVATPRTIETAELEAMFRQLPQPLDDWFSRLELMGGEPLLHPEIERILAMTGRIFPDIDTRLVTNGLLLQNMADSFLETCRDNRIAVYISVYPIELDYEAILRRLDEHGVRHGFYGEMHGTRSFIDYRLDPKGGHSAARNYARCGMGGRCLQLRDYRIYTCFLSAYAPLLNEAFQTSFGWKEDDYLTLEQLRDKNLFHRFINEATPFCRYCCMEKISSSPWHRSKGNREEWLV